MQNEDEINKLGLRLDELSKDFRRWPNLSAREQNVNDFGMTTSGELDAKIAASEARSETKIARIEGKLDLVAQSIGALASSVQTQRAEANSNRTVVVATVITTALALAGLGYAALSYGATNFYNGTVIGDQIRAAASSVPKAATSTK